MGIKRVVPLVVLVIVSMPGASPAAERTERPPAATFLERLSRAQVRLSGSPEDRPMPVPAQIALPRALAEARPTKRGFDMGALGDLARAAVRTYTGDEQAGSTGDQPIHFGVDGGDLDGDARADVLDITSHPDGSMELVARAAMDGTALWSMALDENLADLTLQPLLDADGTSAMLAVLELVYAGGTDVPTPCDLQACIVAGYAEFAWRLSMLDGETGAAVWTRTWDGVLADGFTSTYAPPTGSFGFFGGALNGILALMASDDHDRDGVQDLVIDEIDLLEGLELADAYLEQQGAFAFAYGFASATRASVVRASDGVTLSARTAAGPGLAFLSPGVDGTGDGTRDLLWDAQLAAEPVGGCVFDATSETCAQPLAYARALEMIDGATLTPSWVIPLDTPGWILDAGGDSDGDGSEDLAYLRFGETLTTAVLSGATGAELWHANDVLLGPVGPDVMLGVVVAFTDAELVYTFNRRTGSDGTLVSSTEHRVTLPTDAFDLFILGEFSRIPDADGDARHDAFGQITIFANSTTVDVAVERGDTGAPLFTRHSDTDRFAIPVADASGDGRADLVDVQLTYHRRSFDIGLSVLRLPLGTPAWSATARLGSDSYTILDVTEDMDARGGTDLLLSSIQWEAGGVRAVLYPLSGVDGAKLWEIGGPLTEPPPVPTGGIAGTVTGAGAPFQGACIEVSTLDGSDHAFALAAADGTYVVPELDDGTYVVRFGDCFFFSFVDEWYDDAASMEEATPVVVSGGTITGGIDADLAPA